MSDALPRMTVDEAIVVSGMIRVAEASIPDPQLGTALRKPVCEEELARIREKYPPLELKCDERWDREWRPGMPHALNRNGTSASSVEPNLNRNGAHEPEVDYGWTDGVWPAEPKEDGDADAGTGDEDRWVFNPLMGPGQGWVHRPRQQYTF